MFHPKIALVLGSGGPKGLAHIGVIKTLVKHHIPIDYIVGSSVGSLIGSMFAATQDITSVEQYIIDKNRFQVLTYFAQLTLQGGFVEGTRVERFVDEYLRGATFNELRIPFAAVATNLHTGKKVVLKNGLVARSVRASCAIPVVFKPVEIDGQLLIDGGLVSSVPVDTAIAMGADVVIAVQLDSWYNPPFDLHKLNPLQVGELTLDIVGNKIAEHETPKATILLRPHLESLYWNSFLNQTEKIRGIQAGVDVTEHHLPSITYQTHKASLMYMVMKIAHAVRSTFTRGLSN